MNDVLASVTTVLPSATLAFFVSRYLAKQESVPTTTVFRLIMLAHGIVFTALSFTDTENALGLTICAIFYFVLSGITHIYSMRKDQHHD